MRALILTEANERVASGHLFECIEIGNTLLKHGHLAKLLINSDMQQELKQRIDLPYEEYSTRSDNRASEIIQAVIRFDADIVVTNLREINNDLIVEYNNRNKRGTPLICIDEFGNRTLSCDAIINPMIDPQYWQYPHKKCLEYCGQEYLVLSDNLVEYSNKDKTISERIETITVSMGGVDVRAHALKLADILPKLLPNVNINIVCGGGFTRYGELQELVSDNGRIRLFRNIDFLYELFYGSDLAFCAGGNTLHELSAIGTPVIIIPSMPHEVDNARCFVKAGFGVSIENYRNYSIDDVKMALEMITSRQFRMRMSKNGKKLVDGKGRERIVGIMESMM